MGARFALATPKDYAASQVTPDAGSKADSTQAQTPRRATQIQLAARRHRERLASQARWTIYLAPPPNHGQDDPAIRDWLLAMRRPPIRAGMVARPSGRLSPVWASTSQGKRGGLAPRRWSYVSTTGVYGSGGDRPFDESQPVAPASERAVRRVAAERRLRRAIADSARQQRRQRHHAVGGCASMLPWQPKPLSPAPLLQAHILRAPGIYAQDRLPTARLQAGLPALLAEQDVWTNHIHADDLARACLIGLLRAANARIYNAVDQSDMKMGDYFDAVAAATGLPRPPRMHATEVQAKVSPMMWTFMRESRRLKSDRLRGELRVVLRYPTVADTLRALEVGASAGAA